MGQPAARARIDTGAHTGPIQSGSPDVFIGGFPAARKNDNLACSEHGSGKIISGSGTVFVNGMPLARLGDKTQCNISGEPASAAFKKSAPQYWGGTLAQKAGEDGMLHEKNYDARILGAYASLEDKSANSDFDTVSAGFALEDITLGNMKSQDPLRGEVRSKLAVANATGSLYGGDNNIYGLNANATATGIQYGGSAAAGKEGTLYGGVAGDVTIGTAEAKAVGEIYTGNNGRYGFSADIGAEAHAMKGEAAGNIDILGVITADAKVGGSVGSVGASAGGELYADENDYSLTFGIRGELAVLLGLKGDMRIKFALKPIKDFWDELNDDEQPIAVQMDNGDGKIITGCVTVLIGS